MFLLCEYEKPVLWLRYVCSITIIILVCLLFVQIEELEQHKVLRTHNYVKKIVNAEKTIMQ